MNNCNLNNNVGSSIYLKNVLTLIENCIFNMNNALITNINNNNIY